MLEVSFCVVAGRQTRKIYRWLLQLGDADIAIELSHKVISNSCRLWVNMESIKKFNS